MINEAHFPVVFAQEECQDRKTPEPGHVRFAQEGQGPRAGGPVFQTALEAGSNILAFLRADSAVTAKGFSFVFQADQAAKGTAPKGVAQHLKTMPQDESRALPDGFWEVGKLHPALFA